MQHSALGNVGDLSSSKNILKGVQLILTLTLILEIHCLLFIIVGLAVTDLTITLGSLILGYMILLTA